jgi:alkanesulfonate monooxygenase SsuD/methylene tetrahydromethanopterin reductase-like flavin-dependent oxidoreductase (luciferase family)
MTIRLGLGLPQMRQYDIGRDVPAVARAAEESGYESLWVFERVLLPEPATQGLYGVPGLPWPDQYRAVADPLVTLTLAAAATERAPGGTSVPRDGLGAVLWIAGGQSSGSSTGAISS